MLNLYLQVTSYELRYGKSNCSWASCREGCTQQIFKCHQVRVTYTPKRMYENNTQVDDIAENEWAYLTRSEKQVRSHIVILFINHNFANAPQNNPETGETVENKVEDTPLLINIKGCGYPPEVNCDTYAEKYYNHSMVGSMGGRVCLIIMLPLLRRVRHFLVTIQE